MTLFSFSLIIATTSAFQIAPQTQTWHSSSQFKSAIHNTPSSSSSLCSNNHNNYPTTITTTKTTTALHGKLWKRLEIDEDDPSEGTSWYLLNCVAGIELDLLAQCRMVCADFPTDRVEKFVVPIERHLRSHGDKKKVVDVKVRYPGYVFCKIRLTEDVYETLQELELARSWMGTVNRRGHKKLPPAPIPLNEEEVKKFKGLEEETEKFEDVYGDDYSGRTDTGEDLMEQYAGYDVGQMVKVLRGNFEGEDGTVRRLKDGQLMVRMFTYGQVFDEWFNPDAIRKMTDLEVMRGMSGPTVPVSQDQFDVSIGKKDPSELEGFGDGMGAPSALRSGLMQSAGVAPGRNRREDRVARGDTGSRDMLGRSAEDIKQEEANWLAYREEQRANQRGGSTSPNMPDPFQQAEGSTEPNTWDQVMETKKNKETQPRKGDTWGMTERSSWTGGEFGFEADHAAEEEELRMKTAELYKDRVPRGRKGRDGDQRQNFRDDSRDNRRGGDERERRPVRQGGDRSDSTRGRDRAPRGEDDWSSFSSKPSSPDAGDDKEDDFFASLMSELTDDLSGSSSASEDGSRTRGTRHHDNAGPRPKAAPEKKPSGGDDDFFDSLMSELGGALEQPKSSPKNTNQKKASADDDDFFANLESELSSSMGNDFGDDDAFFDAFESEIKSNTKSTQGEEPDDFSDDDFFASLQQEMSESLNKSPESVDTALREDFLSSLIDDVADELESSNKDEANSRQHTPKEDSSQQTSDVSSLTVPELKDLLRSKGLKVGGKKAELIERLQGN